VKEPNIVGNRADSVCRSSSRRRQALTVSLAVAAVWALGIWTGGCTSDPANPLGAGQLDDYIDTTLAFVDIRALEMFSGLQVNDPEMPVSAQQTLYLGSENGTSTSLLVNFDFGAIDATVYPDSLFTAANIKNVFFSLTKLNPYGGFADSLLVTCDTVSGVCDTITVVYRESEGPRELYYFVHQLEAPFDPADFTAFPAAVPAYDPVILVRDFHLPVESDLPRLKMYEEDIIAWHAAAAPVGLLVQLGPLSDPGLVGFASGELTRFSEVPLDVVGTISGPNLIIEFEDQHTYPNLLIGPADDTTVFEEVFPAPTSPLAASDGFVLRTGLRSYPALRFDLSVLPANALINRAVLSVANDTSLSYGPAFSVMVSEVVPSVMDVSDHQMDVATMGDDTRVFPLKFRSNLRPLVDTVIEFDITAGIRRAINRVTPETRGFLLSGIEDPSVFPFGGLPPDVTRPGFYYREMHFKGWNDPDLSQRPFIRVWYSVVDDLSGGGK